MHKRRSPKEVLEMARSKGVKLVDFGERIGAVLLLPRPVGEPQVHDLDVVLLR